MLIRPIQAQERLAVNRSQFYDLVRKKRLITTKVGARSTRVYERSLLDFLSPDADNPSKLAAEAHDRLNESNPEVVQAVARFAAALYAGDRVRMCRRAAYLLDATASAPHDPTCARIRTMCKRALYNDE